MRVQDVWEDAFKHAIEDHMNCKGAQGWERRWLVVYKSEIVRRHDTAGIWLAFFQERQQLLASGLHSSESATGNMTFAGRRSSSRPAARAWVAFS